MTEEASEVSGEFSDAFAEAAEKKSELAGENADPARAAGEGGGTDEDVETGGSDASGGGQDADPYAELDPAVAVRLRALEDQNKQLEHRLRSDAGRVAAYQRQVTELQAAINAGQQAAERAGSDADKPSMQQVSDAMQDEDAWVTFSEEYPEIAAAIEKRLEKALGTVEQRIAPVVQIAADAEISKGYEYLDTTYKGWRSRVGILDENGESLGPTPEFEEWINRQRPEVRAWADSDSVEDAESLIQLYDAHLTATGKMSKFAQQAGENPPSGKGNGTQTALSRRRQQQLEDGDSIDSRGAGVGVSDDSPAGEFDSFFTAFAKRKERERQRA